MSVKKVRPMTPGQRFRVAPSFAGLARKKPERSLSLALKRTGGRNNTGKMTMRHRGGGHKQRLRLIDFKRRKYDVPGIVNAIEYDPLRTAYIALIHYVDGEKAYILAPGGLNVGDRILAGENIAPELGCALPLKAMPGLQWWWWMSPSRMRYVGK